LTFVDVAGARELADPAEVDWTGFPPASAEPETAPRAA
jgi:hypothetical protein